MSGKTGTAILWFRQDLRLADHAALRAAMGHAHVLPVYVWSPEEEGRWSPGAASRWWLHHALTALTQQLEAKGATLVVRHGAAATTLLELARESGATAVYWTPRCEPKAREQEARVERELQAAGLHAAAVGSPLLFDPATLRTRTGGAFQVFTPFWRTCTETAPPPAFPAPAPTRIAGLPRPPPGVDVAALDLLPDVPWDTGLRAAWTPGEAGAKRALRAFAAEPVRSYHDERDVPAHPGTSRLSPHLHFGELSPRQAWHAILAATGTDDLPRMEAGPSTFLRELGWREFAHHLLWHFPHTPEKPLRETFRAFPWRRDAVTLAAWQRGRTGYPIVDAGLRELWATGWMHNRVRMIVASFLVKDLLLSWEEGAAWFWDTLVDADLANNTLGWQWAGGCGADAAPFFRIFNPVAQGERFDADGRYVRRWVPELAALPDTWLHRPWEAPAAARRDAGGAGGAAYPARIVDHGEARARALTAFAAVRARAT